MANIEKVSTEIMTMVVDTMAANNLTIDETYTCAVALVNKMIMLKHDCQKAVIHKQIGAVPLKVEERKEDDV